MEARVRGDNWHITETEFDPSSLHHKETLFTIGNGYLGTRGTFEEGYPGDWAFTLIHGVFDDVPIVNTELVNAPNWLHLQLFVDGERFRMDRGQVLGYHRDLDLATGVLSRAVRWRSPGGHTLDLAFERFASLADEHVLGLRVRVTPVDFAGSVELHAALPGFVDNQGYLHWEWADQGPLDKRGAYLAVRTKQTRLLLCEACQLQISGADVQTWTHDCHWTPGVVARAQISPGGTLCADKLVTVFTSRDTADPQGAALAALVEAASRGYEALRASSDAAWAETWDACNITIEGDDEADRAVRYSLFQLLIAAPRHDERVSIGAKSLSGPGYHGHVFWDTEIFMLPFFTYTQPQLARNMLLYRHHTLPGARRVAEEAGYEGALYAWESAATGDETTPRWVPDPGTGELVRIWTGDIEYHVVADVAYAVHQYWQVTGDDAFMCHYGAEMMLDTARFWASLVEWNERRGVYEINDVIGPDEYHDHVDNNAFTNRMAVWNLEAALTVLDWLRTEYAEKAEVLAEELDLSGPNLKRWQDIIDRIHIPQDVEGSPGRGPGLIEQFDGFFDLKAVDLEDYEPRSTSMQSLLGIEETQGYQVIKQPDVLMLLYLLEPAYDPEVVKVNWDYYTPRTDHTYGSSLGPAIQAALAGRHGDPDGAYEHFVRAIRTDLEDARGNAAQGIHAAAAGGIWQAVVFGFAGIRLTERGPAARPRLPAHWRRITFHLRYRGERYHFDLS
jgi:kojibiose phosphorylase